MSCKGWNDIKLGEIVNTNVSSITKLDKYTYINYLDTGSICSNEISNIQYINVQQEKVPSRAKRKVKVNDIVFSNVRPNQRHYGIIKAELPNMVVSTGFTTISTKKYLCDPYFV